MRAPVSFDNGTCKMQTVTEQRDGTFTVTRFGQTIRVEPDGYGFNQAQPVDHNRVTLHTPQRILERNPERSRVTLAEQVGMWA